MDYKAEILTAEKKLLELKKNFKKLKAVVATLKVGDTVYEEGTHGGWDMEYYPKEILEIDLENAKLFVFEKSIDKKHWMTSFHIERDGKMEFCY